MLVESSQYHHIFMDSTNMRHGGDAMSLLMVNGRLLNVTNQETSGGSSGSRGSSSGSSFVYEPGQQAYRNIISNLLSQLHAPAPWAT